MSISYYFGVPGCGKTSLLAKHALEGSKKYKNVYVNVHLSNMPDNVRYIENDWIGKYDISDGLLLTDESTLFVDNRDYKSFGKDLKQFAMLHRHYGITWYLYGQSYSGLDKKLRSLIGNNAQSGVFYVYKPLLFGRWITKYYRVPYGIVIPDRKKNKALTGNSLGEIEEGYCKPSLFNRIFCKRFIRFPYYKYFDSWEAPELPPLPTFKE